MRPVGVEQCSVPRAAIIQEREGQAMIEKTGRASTIALIGWLALCFAVAGIASFISARSNPAWYAGLSKPAWTPPNAVFGPVWMVLYALMAVAAWLVWKTSPSACRRRGLLLFCVQLGLNLLWVWIFFGRHQLLTALADLAPLWIGILLTMQTFRKMSSIAAWLLVPYLVWVTFALYIHWEIWRLNP